MWLPSPSSLKRHAGLLQLLEAHPRNNSSLSGIMGKAPSLMGGNGSPLLFGPICPCVHSASEIFSNRMSVGRPLPLAGLPTRKIRACLSLKSNVAADGKEWNQDSKLKCVFLIKDMAPGTQQNISTAMTKH